MRSPPNRWLISAYYSFFLLQLEQLLPVDVAGRVGAAPPVCAAASATTLRSPAARAHLKLREGYNDESGRSSFEREVGYDDLLHLLDLEKWRPGHPIIWAHRKLLERLVAEGQLREGGEKVGMLRHGGERTSDDEQADGQHLVEGSAEGEELPLGNLVTKGSSTVLSKRGLQKAALKLFLASFAPTNTIDKHNEQATSIFNRRHVADFLASLSGSDGATRPVELDKILLQGIFAVQVQPVLDPEGADDASATKSKDAVFFLRLLLEVFEERLLVLETHDDHYRRKPVWSSASLWDHPHPPYYSVIEASRRVPPTATLEEQDAVAKTLPTSHRGSFIWRAHREFGASWKYDEHEFVRSSFTHVGAALPFRTHDRLRSQAWGPSQLYYTQLFRKELLFVPENVREIYARRTMSTIFKKSGVDLDDERLAVKHLEKVLARKEDATSPGERTRTGEPSSTPAVVSTAFGAAEAENSTISSVVQPAAAVSAPAQAQKLRISDDVDLPFKHYFNNEWIQLGNGQVSSLRGGIYGWLVAGARGVALLEGAKRGEKTTLEELGATSSAGSRSGAEGPPPAAGAVPVVDGQAQNGTSNDASVTEAATASVVGKGSGGKGSTSTQSAGEAKKISSSSASTSARELTLATDDDMTSSSSPWAQRWLKMRKEQDTLRECVAANKLLQGKWSLEEIAVAVAERIGALQSGSSSSCPTLLAERILTTKITSWTRGLRDVGTALLGREERFLEKRDFVEIEAPIDAKNPLGGSRPDNFLFNAPGDDFNLLEAVEFLKVLEAKAGRRRSEERTKLLLEFWELFAMRKLLTGDVGGATATLREVLTRAQNDLRLGTSSFLQNVCGKIAAGHNMVRQLLDVTDGGPISTEISSPEIIVDGEDHEWRGQQEVGAYQYGTSKGGEKVVARASGSGSYHLDAIRDGSPYLQSFEALFCSAAAATPAFVHFFLDPDYFHWAACRQAAYRAAENRTVVSAWTEAGCVRGESSASLLKHTHLSRFLQHHQPTAGSGSTDSASSSFIRGLDSDENAYYDGLYPKKVRGVFVLLAYAMDLWRKGARSDVKVDVEVVTLPLDEQAGTTVPPAVDEALAPGEKTGEDLPTATSTHDLPKRSQHPVPPAKVLVVVPRPYSWIGSTTSWISHFRNPFDDTKFFRAAHLGPLNRAVDAELTPVVKLHGEYAVQYEFDGDVPLESQTPVDGSGGRAPRPTWVYLNQYHATGNGEKYEPRNRLRPGKSGSSVVPGSASDGGKVEALTALEVQKLNLTYFQGWLHETIERIFVHNVTTVLLLGWRQYEPHLDLMSAFVQDYLDDFYYSPPLEAEENFFAGGGFGAETINGTAATSKQHENTIHIARDFAFTPQPHLPFYTGRPAVAGMCITNDTGFTSWPIYEISRKHWKLEYKAYPTGYLQPFKLKHQYRWLQGETTSGTRIMSSELYVDFLKSFFSKWQREILYGERFADQRQVRGELDRRFAEGVGDFGSGAGAGTEQKQSPASQNRDREKAKALRREKFVQEVEAAFGAAADAATESSPTQSTPAVKRELPSAYTSMPESFAHQPTHANEWWDVEERRTDEDLDMAEQTFDLLKKELPPSEWHGDIVDGEIDHNYVLSGEADFMGEPSQEGAGTATRGDANGHDYGDLDAVEFFVDMDLHFRFHYRGYVNREKNVGEADSAGKASPLPTSTTPTTTDTRDRPPSAPVPVYTYYTHRWLGRDTWLRHSDHLGRSPLDGVGTCLKENSYADKIRKLPKRLALKYQIEVLRVPYGLETWSLRRGWNDPIRLEPEEFRGVSFSPRLTKHHRVTDCRTVLRFLALKGFLQRGYLKHFFEQSDIKTVAGTNRNNASKTMRKPAYFGQFAEAVGQMRGVLSEFLWMLARDYLMDNGFSMSYCARKEMIVTFKAISRAWRGWWPKRNVIMPITGTLTHLMRNPRSVYALDFDIDVGLCQMRLPGDNEGELRWRGQLASAQFCAMHLGKLGYVCYERTGFTEVSNPSGIGVGVDFFFLTAAVGLNFLGAAGTDLGKAVLFGEEVHWLEHQRVELYADYVPGVKIMNWIHPWHCAQVWETSCPRDRSRGDSTKSQSRFLIGREIAHPACLPQCGDSSREMPGGTNIGCEFDDDDWHTEDEFPEEEFAVSAQKKYQPKDTTTLTVSLEFEYVHEDAAAAVSAATSTNKKSTKIVLKQPGPQTSTLAAEVAEKLVNFLAAAEVKIPINVAEKEVEVAVADKELVGGNGEAAEMLQLNATAAAEVDAGRVEEHTLVEQGAADPPGNSTLETDELNMTTNTTAEPPKPRPPPPTRSVVDFSLLPRKLKFQPLNEEKGLDLYFQPELLAAQMAAQQNPNQQAEVHHPQLGITTGTHSFCALFCNESSPLENPYASVSPAGDFAASNCGGEMDATTIRQRIDEQGGIASLLDPPATSDPGTNTCYFSRYAKYHNKPDELRANQPSIGTAIAAAARGESVLPSALKPSAWEVEEQAVAQFRWYFLLSKQTKTWLNGLPTPLLEQWSVDCWHGGMWVSFERCCDMEISPDSPGAYRGTSEGVGFNAACHTFFGNHNTYERCCLAEYILVERKAVLYESFLERVKTLRSDRRWLTVGEYALMHDNAGSKPPGFFSVPDEPKLGEMVPGESGTGAPDPSALLKPFRDDVDVVEEVAIAGKSPPPAPATTLKLPLELDMSKEAVSPTSTSEEETQQKSTVMLKSLVLGDSFKQLPWQSRWLGFDMDVAETKRRSDLNYKHSKYESWIETPFPNFFGVREGVTFVRQLNMTKRILLLQEKLEELKTAWTHWGSSMEQEGVRNLVRTSGMKLEAPKGYFQRSVFAASHGVKPKAAAVEITAADVVAGAGAAPAPPPPPPPSVPQINPSSTTSTSFASTSVHSRAEEELNINSLQMLLDRGQYKVKNNQVGGCMNRFGRPVCCDEIEPEVEETASCLNTEEFGAQQSDFAIVTGVFGPGDKNEFTVGAIKMGKSLNAVLGQDLGVVGSSSGGGDDTSSSSASSPSTPPRNRKRRADLIILEINQFPIAPAYRKRLKQAGWKICSVTCVKNRSFVHQPALRHRFTFTKFKLLSFVQYRKAMWLDSDVQIVGGIDELVDFDFRATGRDCRMAAVRDLMIDSQNAKQPGIENRHNFNAGLMIVEPSWQDYWRMMGNLGSQHGDFHPGLRKMWWDRDRRVKMRGHYLRMNAKMKQVGSEEASKKGVPIQLSRTAVGELKSGAGIVGVVNFREATAATSADNIEDSAGDAAAATERDGDETLRNHYFLMLEQADSTFRSSSAEGNIKDHPPSDANFTYFLPDADPAIFLEAEPLNTLTAHPIAGTLFNPTTNKRSVVYHNAAIFITHPSMSETGAIELEDAVKYLPDPTFSEQGMWNDNYRHSWCRLPCKFNAILPYILVPRLRFIWERCSRDARIVHWALFKPHFCPKLEPRFVSVDRNITTVDETGSAPSPTLSAPAATQDTDRPEPSTEATRSTGTGTGSHSQERAHKKNPAGFFTGSGEAGDGAQLSENQLLGQNSHYIAPTEENGRFYFTNNVTTTSSTSTTEANEEGEAVSVSPYFPQNKVRVVESSRFPKAGWYDYDPEFSLRGYLWNLGNSGMEARLVLRLFCWYYHIV
eukprot:g617.t1